MAKNKITRKGQFILDFDNPEIEWPANKYYPLNLPNYSRSVLSEIIKDAKSSKKLLIVTGFTSLAHVIDFFGKDLNDGIQRKSEIILGFEPEIRRRKYWGKADLDKEIKDYWLERGYSIFHGGRVIDMIERIKNGSIEFRILDKLHAKIYIFNDSAILGSANFSINGLTRQKEANIRIEAFVNPSQYSDIKNIAENYYKLGDNYNEKMISLLQQLIKVTSWQEALARAIASLVEGTWFRDYPELNAKLNSIKLWPSQRIALGQAINIIQNQGCLLIADPTGSGKTKLISTLQLVLFHWLWETGRKNKSYSLTICPPLVTSNWEREFLDISFAITSPESMGLLSYSKGDNYSRMVKKIKNSNILVVDEAHNFLNLSSKRSENIGKNTADFVILATATPISKKAKDLLRLIELLGVDNLSDDELNDFLKIRRLKSIKNEANLDRLRTYIKRFIVRRTKKQLKLLISREPDKYLNRHGKQCKFPNTQSKTYKTGESNEDKAIAREIDSLAKDLSGVIYLRKFEKPEFFDVEDEKYIELRLKAAKSLSIYNIRAALRSSSVALYELINGTESTLKHYRFKSSKSNSGNILKTIRSYVGTTINNSFDNELLPLWLREGNQELYDKVCKTEIEIYEKISKLVLRLSAGREMGKISVLKRLLQKHDLVLAFDSTIITLDYLKYLFYSDIDSPEIVVVTGSTKKDAAIRKFELGSNAKNVIGLLSDSMSEGVNLQQASALIFLDMPSVLRIAEQRIGRIDRLDSPHNEVEIHWPDDSAEFALKTDSKLISTSFATETLIGGNFDIPEEILDKHLDHVVKPQEMIRALANSSVEDVMWEGVHDAFLPVHELYSGNDRLLSYDEYNHLKDVEASVKVKVSLLRSNDPWIFLALKGDNLMAPKWILINSEGGTTDDLNEICLFLRNNLKTEITSIEWDDNTTIVLGKFLEILQQKQIAILPNKKKRAIQIAKELLESEKRKKSSLKEGNN